MSVENGILQLCVLELFTPRENEYLMPKHQILSNILSKEIL